MKLAVVAKTTQRTINVTGLRRNDLPPGLADFITSQFSKIKEFEQVETKWLAEAETMPVQRLQIIVDEMWSGWVRAQLCEVLDKRNG